jgi:hypothetical protein
LVGGIPAASHFCSDSAETALTYGVLFEMTDICAWYKTPGNR